MDHKGTYRISKNQKLETRNLKLTVRPRRIRRGVAAHQASGSHADDHQTQAGQESVVKRIVQRGNELRKEAAGNFSPCAWLQKILRISQLVPQVSRHGFVQCSKLRKAALHMPQHNRT